MFWAGHLVFVVAKNLPDLPPWSCSQERAFSRQIRCTDCSQTEKQRDRETERETEWERTGVEDGSVVPAGSQHPTAGHDRSAEETDGVGGEKWDSLITDNSSHCHTDTECLQWAGVLSMRCSTEAAGSQSSWLGCFIIFPGQTSRTAGLSVPSGGTSLTGMQCPYLPLFNG